VPDPLYQRIADDLRQKIESGALAPGSQLPTELDLRDQYRASRNTVRDAVGWLITRRLVQRKPGQGTFVVEQTEPFITTLSADPETGLGGGEGEAYVTEVRDQGREPSTTDPRVEILQASQAVGAELGIATGDTVVARQQLRYIDRAPYSLQTSYYPMSLVTDGAGRLIEAVAIQPGTVDYLREELGLHQAAYRDKITVRVPNAEESAFFRLPDSGRVSVFETFRTAFDTHGKPFRLTVSVFPTDRNQFVVIAGRVPTEARHWAGAGARASTRRG
jgi:GntR family transcriptional regulator